MGIKKRRHLHYFPLGRELEPKRKIPDIKNNFLSCDQRSAHNKITDGKRFSSIGTGRRKKNCRVRRISGMRQDAFMESTELGATTLRQKVAKSVSKKQGRRCQQHEK